MQVFCHKCGEELPAGSGESPFCPHCGSPQLYLAMENQSVETGGEPAAVAEGEATTGALPPPSPRQIDWKAAIRCAAAVAAIGSALTVGSMRVEALSPVSMLWVLSASLITMGLYQKRRPGAWMDVRSGARIGVVVGVCLALGMAVLMAGWGLVSRFGLHTMGSFDAQVSVLLQQMQTTMQQKAQQQSTPVPPEMAGLVNSPEFRALLALTYFGLVTAFLMVLSTLGGAFAGLLARLRQPVAR